MNKNVADDVWYEIYLRLPMDAIFKFKSVSKVWLSTLSSPNFIHKWYKLNCASLPWVLVQYNVPLEDDSLNDNNKLRRRFTITHPDSHSQFVSQHQNGFTFSFLDPNQGWKQNEIVLMGSSNGLVLCRTRSLKYCVCNPLTQKWISIPPPPPPPPPTPENSYIVTGFSSSLVSTNFKVICIHKFEAAVKEFKVEMFSSESGEWNVYNVSCAQDVTWVLSSYDNLVTHNGVLYWLQKKNKKILAVSIGGNINNGICGHDCRLVDMPDQVMDDDLNSRHRLGESEGSICYAIVKEREKSLSVWVLEEDWCLLYKDNQFHDMLAELETLLIDEIGTDDLIKELKILGFNPIDRNVVILGYDKYIWAYNTITKGYEQLFHPSFLGTSGPARLSFLTFPLKPWPTVLPPVSW